MKEKFQICLITDCGSTTTKAILVEKQGDEYRQTCRAEAPTTVEEPLGDITIGVRDALEQLELQSGRAILDEAGQIIRPSRDGQGVDLYLSTCSAGGGLRLLVVGLVERMSAQTARRAALGAGAVVTNIISCDDPSPMDEQLGSLRDACPDMVLFVGGVEDGARAPVQQLAEQLAANRPQHRCVDHGKLPLIFAGNSRVARDVIRTLSSGFSCYEVENLRPTLEDEVILPVRDKIQELFLDHVMTRAPGFGNLVDLVDAPIKPTPRAVGDLLQDVASAEERSILLADLGGATTDIFTVIDGTFERTVSANLGVSYSAAQVLCECGFESIAKWLPFEIDEAALFNSVLGKTVRPITIPDSFFELWIEQALAREALGLAVRYHFGQEWGLKGARSARSAGSFLGPVTGERRHSIADVDLIIASGGVLSSAPDPWQTAAMMVDALLPEGITALAKDSIFMIPHLGVLLGSDKDVAREVFERDCLQYLGTCVAPTGKPRPDRICLEYEVSFEQTGVSRTGALSWGELRCLETPSDGNVSVVLSPARGSDVGFGKGKQWTGQLAGGLAGIVLDCRGRPLVMQKKDEEKMKQMKRWFEAYQSPIAMERVP